VNAPGYSRETNLTPDEAKWVNESNDPLAQQARAYYTEAQTGSPRAVESFWALVFERRAQLAGADIDPLGDWDALELDPLADRTIIGVYGDGETGKSTDVLKTFARNNLPRPRGQGGGVFSRGSILITSASSVAAPYAGWVAQNPEKARERGNLLPDQIRWWNIPERQPDGVTPFPASTTLLAYMRRIMEAQARGRMDYGAIIIDEFTAIMDRVYSEFEHISQDPGDARFKADKRKAAGWPHGMPDGFAVFGAVQSFLRQVLSMGRARGNLPPMRLVLVGHPRPGDDGYAGMMKMPSRASGQLLFNECDFFLRLYKRPVQMSIDTGNPSLPGVAPTEAQVEARQQALTSMRLSAAPMTEGGGRCIQTSSDNAWAAKARAYTALEPVEEGTLEHVLRTAGVLLPHPDRSTASAA
jgi:hypothetical protein